MNIRVIGSTCGAVENALNFAGHAAGVCYMSSNYYDIVNESREKTERRIKNTLESGHHSVYDHIVYNLLLEDIPIILTIVLNNEGWYTTSQKSARYTRLEGSTEEMIKYYKWLDIFKELIGEKYGDKFLAFYGTEKKTKSAIEKLAQENARYMLSVFTPTTMIYSASLRQINYLVNFFKNFSRTDDAHSDFYEKLKTIMMEFVDKLPRDMIIPELNANVKRRDISLFCDSHKEEEHFGEVYNTQYYGTWSCYGQAQRHRTLSYKISFMDYFVAYTPDILPLGYWAEWEEDMKSLEHLYPNGRLMEIYEYGTFDKFLLKCYERMCGAAQLEIMKTTKDTLSKYHEARPDLVPDSYMKGARCTFPCFKCNGRCVWGAKEGIDRQI